MKPHITFKTVAFDIGGQSGVRVSVMHEGRQLATNGVRFFKPVAELTAGDREHAFEVLMYWLRARWGRLVAPALQS